MSRLRGHSAANIMGETLTNFWDTLPTDVYDYYILSDSEWVASDCLNAATNDNFTSWQDFYGPQEYNGDTFTTSVSFPASSFCLPLADFHCVSNVMAFRALSSMRKG